MVQERNAAASAHTTAPINHTRPSPRKHSPDGAAHVRKQTSDYSLILSLSTSKGWKAESTCEAGWESNPDMSPIPVLTGLDVEQLRWYDQLRSHYATPPPMPLTDDCTVKVLYSKENMKSDFNAYMPLCWHWESHLTHTLSSCRNLLRLMWKSIRGSTLECMWSRRLAISGRLFVCPYTKCFFNFSEIWHCR